MKTVYKNIIRKVRKSPFVLMLLINIIGTPQIYSQSAKEESLPTYKVIFLKNLFSDVDMNDAVAALKVWVKEIVKTIKPEFKLNPVLVDNIENVNSSSLNDVALVCLNSVDYLNYKAKLNLEGAFVPLKGGQIFSEYILLTKENIKNLTELRGTKIGVKSKSNYSISNMWLGYLLDRNKLPMPNKYFSEIKESDKESQLILSVFFEQINACIVTKNSFNLMKELNPQVGKRLKILDVSPDLIQTVTAFTKNFKNEEHRKLIIKAAEQLNSYPGGKQLLTLMNTDQVISFRKEYTDNVNTLIKDYKEITAMSKN